MTCALMDIGPTECLWPFGDRAPFQFCGEPRAERSPYCPLHTARAYANWTARVALTADEQRAAIGELAAIAAAA